jgi:hypothetical protein
MQPQITHRLSTDDRIRLLVETFDKLPDVRTIAAITGARSETSVKAVLFDLSQQDK